MAGTVAGGEPRITRLDDYRLDMAPADVMLITRHRTGRARSGGSGIMLGEADVNISAMHLARTRPREDALMILALDDDVPAGVAEAIRAHEDVIDAVDDPPGRRRAERRRRSSRTASTRRSSSSATASPSSSSRAGSRARPTRPLSPTGRAPGGAGRRAGSPTPRAPPALPIPAGPPLEIVHSPLGRAAADRRRHRDAIAAASRGRPRRADPGFPRSARASGKGLHRDEIAARYGAELDGLARADPPRPGRPAASRSPEVAARVRPGPARPCSRGLAERPAPGDARPTAGRRLRGSPRRRARGRSSSATTACSRSLLLTLFDLPLDRFWMWSFDLCGITVVEFRAGRPVLRAHNLTEHLAPLQDAAALAERRAAARLDRARSETRLSGGRALAASEREAQQVRAGGGARAARRARSRSSLEPAAPVDGLDLGPGDQSRAPAATIGRTSPSDAGVLVDGLVGSRPEPEPRGEPGHGPIGAVGGGPARAGRAARR